MWKFIKSSTNNQNFLMGHAKEVAFIGRSNVGKSSLINAICNNKSLARTSNTPGRTQLINFFQEDNKVLVDLPGYGYAKMPLNIKAKMFAMIENYFGTRKELMKVYVLVDTKIGPTEDDIQMIEYLSSINRKVFVVMTKSDKANQSQAHKSILKVKALGVDFLQVSSFKGKNITKLKSIINIDF